MININFIKNKNKIVTMILSIIILVGVIYFSNNINIKTKINTKEEKNEIIDNKKHKDIELIYNKEKLPKYKDGYLIPFNSENEMINNLSSKYKYVIYLDDTYEEKIKNNKYIEIIIISDNYYDIKKLYLTKLSVVNIDKNNFTLFENSDKINIKKSEMDYHVRGDSSQSYDKKSYKVNMSEKIKLLDMRKDDDWILNAIAVDDSLLREKVSLSIWNDISDINNHTAEYVELFIDDEYIGLYLLQEPVDQHTFGNNENTFYYSIKTYHQSGKFRLKFFEGDVYANEFMFEKLDDSQVEQSFDVLKTVYEDLENEGIDDVIYDANNLYNYEMFLNLINSYDNVYKNQKLAITEKEGKYYLTKTVWDLDLSMMNNKQTFFKYEGDEIHLDRMKSEYYQTDEQLKKQAELYFKYREKYYKNQYVLDTVNKSYNQLLISGAYIRNNEKWDIENDAFLQEVDVVKNSLTDRINFLDKYYGDML